MGIYSKFKELICKILYQLIHTVQSKWEHLWKLRYSVKHKIDQLTLYLVNQALILIQYITIILPTIHKINVFNIKNNTNSVIHNTKTTENKYLY